MELLENNGSLMAFPYDESQVFIFGVYRDPNYSSLGTGNLRAHAEFYRENVSRFSIIDYAETRQRYHVLDGEHVGFGAERSLNIPLR